MAHVYIKCRNCRYYNKILTVAPNRIEPAVFRGSEDPIKCTNCYALMDTMTAFCGEQDGLDVIRLKDPK